MNWNLGNLSLVDGMLYADERYLGTFSSHEAGLAAIEYKRYEAYNLLPAECLTESDFDLLEEIDADEP